MEPALSSAFDRANYYDAVDIDDSVFRAFEGLKSHPEYVGTYDLVNGSTYTCGPQKPVRVEIWMTPGADFGPFMQLAKELCSAFLRCAKLISHVVTAKRLAA